MPQNRKKYSQILFFVLLIGGALGSFQGYANATIVVKNPERFTNVKAWDLTVTWSAGENISQKMPNSPMLTMANVAFSGSMKTVLQPAEDGMGWNNLQDTKATWSANLKAEKRIQMPMIPDVVWRWHGHEEKQQDSKPSAELLIDLYAGTFNLNGCLYYINICTRMDAKPPTKTEDTSSVYIQSQDDESRKINYLPKSGNNLSGSAVVPATFHCFSGFLPGVKPKPMMIVTWTLTPRPEPKRFTYKPSASNIEALKWEQNIVVGHEVGIEPDSGNWSLHSNWEGQVYVDGKPMLKIDKRPETKKRVEGQYAIRRLSRTWRFTETSNYKPERVQMTQLPEGWNYDSNELEEDWLDQAAAAHLAKNDWPLQATLDEFLIGVFDMKPEVKGVPANEIKDRDAAVKASQAYPDDTYFEAISGLKEFKFAYVSYIIEVHPFPNHPKVFRITYHVENDISLETYKTKYQQDKPGWNYPMGGKTRWKEVVGEGKHRKVVDLNLKK